jgi:Protein of Unknown function (DUF2784)
VNRWRALADFVVVIHAAYVAFVVVGLLAIVAGWTLGWRWVRNVWFRGAHLASIALVLVESVVGLACPLTTLENSLRQRAGQAGYPSDFISYWIHRLIFYEWPPWVFFMLYAGFTTLVVAVYWLIPPERRKRRGDRIDASRLP